VSLLFAVLVVGAASLAAQQQPPATPYAPKQSDRPEALSGDEAGFHPIFDGRTLTGWDGNPTYWRAENGSIVGEITPSTLIRSNTFLVWRGGRPRDFELKLDYRITSEGNSGINYRSTVIPDAVTPENRFAMRGYQCDIDGRQRYTGNNYEEKGRLFLAVRGQLTHVVGNRVPVVLATMGTAGTAGTAATAGTGGAQADACDLAKVLTNDWNSVHLIARGNTLTHIINGRVMTVVVDDDAPNRPADGLIGVQVHVGPPMKIEYRNIRLKNW
jgi:hypothetical protein